MDFFVAAQALKEIEKAFLCFNDMADFPLHRDPQQFIVGLRAFLSEEQLDSLDRDYYTALLNLYEHHYVCRRAAQARSNRIAVINKDKF